MPVADAVKDFKHTGLIADSDPAEIDGYFEDLHKKEAASAFWDAAADGLWDSGSDELSCLLRSCNVAREYGGPALVGAARIDAVLGLLKNIGRRRPLGIVDAPALVFPYETLPGIYSGFLLVQPDSDGNQQKTFISTTSERKHPDAGYFLLRKALQKQHPQLRDSQFIVDDPFWALKQQYLQRSMGLPDLPIMAAYYSKDARSSGRTWASFPPAKRIFHAATYTPATISCACNAKGYVSASDATTNRPHRTNSSLFALAKIKRKAVTWNNALAAAVAPLAEPVAYSFFSRLYMPADSVVAFVKKTAGHFSDAFAARVISAVLDKRATASPPKDKFTIVEKNGQWVTAAGRPICTGTLRITKVIYTDKNEKFYSGYAAINEKRVEFIEAANKIEITGLLEYAAQQFAARGQLFVYDRRWNLTAHVRVMQMYPPDIINVPSGPGWSDAAQVFSLGDYNITPTGDIQPAVTVPTIAVTQTFPEPPATLPALTHKFLTPAYVNSFMWSAFAAFMHAALAPVLGVDATSVAVAGTNFKLAAELWATLGAGMHELLYVHTNNVSIYVNDKTKRTNWPVCVSSLFNDDTLSYTTLRCHNRPLLARLSHTCAHVAPSYGWNVITAPDELQNEPLTVFRYIMPAYLRHVMAHRLRYPVGDSALIAILRDIHDWLLETTGATFNLAYAEQNLLTPKKAHMALFAEIGAAAGAGHIDLIPRPRRRDQPKNYILQQKNTWWLNKTALDLYFKAQKSVPPNWPEIVNLLANNAVSVEVEHINGLSGYRVDSKWCEQHIANNSAISIKAGT